MRKFYTWIITSFTLMAFLAIIEYPDNNFHVVTCDVGQGDSILIYRRFSQILVDGGGNDLVSDCLLDNLPWFDKRIDLVILTHPQEDHMKGLVEVLETYEVGLLLTSGGINDTNTFWDFREKISNKNIKVKLASLGDKLRIGDIDIYVKWPESSVISESEWNKISAQDDWEKYISNDHGSVLGLSSYDPNIDSLVVEVKYGDISLLMTGDIGLKEEQALLELGVITPVNILKVAHHGSKSSTSKEFLEVTRPNWALVSVGENNHFGHPSGEVLMYLDMVGAKIYRTDERGTIELLSDGKKIWER